MNNIQFRVLEEKDLPQLQKWMNTDFVMEWYGKTPVTIEDLRKKYIPRILGEEPTNAYISIVNNIDVGYIQTYLIKDYPDYNQHVEADEHTAGVDLFIGHNDYIHKGYGVHIMNSFLQQHVFTNQNVDKCIIGPEPKNLSAIRMYEKVGFKWYKNIQLPDEDEPEYLMRLFRNDFVMNFE